MLEGAFVFSHFIAVKNKEDVRTTEEEPDFWAAVFKQRETIWTGFI